MVSVWFLNGFCVVSDRFCLFLVISYGICAVAVCSPWFLRISAWLRLVSVWFLVVSMWFMCGFCVVSVWLLYGFVRFLSVSVDFTRFLCGF